MIGVLKSTIGQYISQSFIPERASIIMSAKSGYRRLIRSAKHVFGNDAFAYQSARKELKMQFIKNKEVKDPVELNSLLRGIEEVDEMLRFNVVQGTLNNRGNFDVSLSPEHFVTVEAHQDEPHGPELAVPDSSLLGKSVKVLLVIVFCEPELRGRQHFLHTIGLLFFFCSSSLGLLSDSFL